MRIGIIGGGQLGMLLAVEARALGAHTVVLDTSVDAPAFRVCDESIVAASFADAQALERLFAAADVVTYEFENVPAEVLVPLAEKYGNIKQGIRQLFDSQDRLVEKRNAEWGGLPCGRYAAVDTADDLYAAVAQFGLPCVLKSRREGYDGHGQMVLRSDGDVREAALQLNVPMILEEFIAFDYEASVVMVADAQRVVAFPVGQNIHREGILDVCIVPAPQMSEPLRRHLTEASCAFMRRCGYEGILAIEYFICGDRFLFNEMAPRPHNSGHYTIEGCTTSQFREAVRYLMGLPLEEPQIVGQVVAMKNILGRDLPAAQAVASLGREDVHIHLYGKSQARPKRKMGHMTMTGAAAGEFLGGAFDRFWNE